MIEKIDFLVIGAGSAGLSTALQLQKFGNVLVLAKKGLDDCNSWWAAGGIAASGPWNDDYEGHVQDTLEAGDGLCNETTVRFIVNKSTERIQDLMDWGLEFDASETGEFELGQEGGHHTRRILHTTDETGKSILQVLLDQCKLYANIEIRPHQYAINLIGKKGECCGAYVLNNATQEIYSINSNQYKGKKQVSYCGGANRGPLIASRC